MEQEDTSYWIRRTQASIAGEHSLMGWRTQFIEAAGHRSLGQEDTGHWGRRTNKPLGQETRTTEEGGHRPEGKEDTVYWGRRTQPLGQEDTGHGGQEDTTYWGRRTQSTGSRRTPATEAGRPSPLSLRKRNFFFSEYSCYNFITRLIHLYQVPKFKTGLAGVAGRVTLGHANQTMTGSYFLPGFRYSVCQYIRLGLSDDRVHVMGASRTKPPGWRTLSPGLG